jgi:hypothetical protein
VVALLGLLQLMQVGVEIFFARPGRAVDALEHGLRRIPAPIGAGDLQELEALADLPRRGHMRPAAEIEPLALRVDFDLVPLGYGVDQLELEGFALVGEQRLRLLAVHDLAGERGIARDDLAHLGLDDGKIVGREGLIPREVVIEAVLDDRANGDLRAGIELLHGLGHHMRRVVADERERLGIGTREEFDRRVGRDGRSEVGKRAVETHRHRALRKRRRDRLGDVEARGAGRHLALCAIGKCQGNLRHKFRFLSLLRTSAGKSWSEVRGRPFSRNCS